MNDTFNAVDVAGWELHVEFLHKYFYEHADLKCLLWVNPAQEDAFKDVPLVQEQRIRVPINHPRFDVSLGPYLVPLDLSRSAHSDILRASMEIAWNAWSAHNLQAFQGQPISGWVAINGEPSALAHHWATRCHLHRRDGLNKFLRFHDPSVREWLWRTLSPTQKRAMLGTASVLFSIGRGQELMSHESPKSGLEAVEHRTTAQPLPTLVLDDKQWNQVEDYATVHAAWLAYTNMQGANAANSQAHGWEQRIFEALSHASLYGVTDPLDRELFALHTLQMNAEFHASTRMRPVWVKTLAGDFYGGALEEVFELPADRLHTHLLDA